MSPDLSVTFTGIRFENPFLLASAPPTESDTNIMRAFEAGWGGVVTKTIGLHPVVNVVGAKTKLKILSMNPKPSRTQTAIAMHELMMRFRSSSRCSRNDIFELDASSSSSRGESKARDWGPGKGTRAIESQTVNYAP